jgi:hypothetical protein
MSSEYWCGVKDHVRNVQIHQLDTWTIKALGWERAGTHQVVKSTTGSSPREPRRLGAGGRRRRRRPRCYQVAPLSCPVLSSLSVRPRPQQRDSADWSGQGGGIKGARAQRAAADGGAESSFPHTTHVLGMEKRTPPPTPKRNSRRPSPPPRNREGKGGKGERGTECVARAALAYHC